MHEFIPKFDFEKLVEFESIKFSFMNIVNV
jgi:hypothetical protein